MISKNLTDKNSLMRDITNIWIVKKLITEELADLISNNVKRLCSAYSIASTCTYTLMLYNKQNVDETQDYNIENIVSFIINYRANSGYYTPVFLFCSDVLPYSFNWRSSLEGLKFWTDKSYEISLAVDKRFRDCTSETHDCNKLVNSLLDEILIDINTLINYHAIKTRNEKNVEDVQRTYVI